MTEGAFDKNHSPWGGIMRQGRWIGRIGVVAGGLAASLALTAATAVRAADVEIVRDRYGVPHVYAATTHDLFLGYGYAVAEDRLFQMEMAKRSFTGRVAGVPCFREGKIQRVELWLAGLGRRLADFAESRFYSDSHNDLPLLARVTHPVAVDPDPQLAAEAARRGWPVLSLHA